MDSNQQATHRPTRRSVLKNALILGAVGAGGALAYNQFSPPFWISGKEPDTSRQTALSSEQRAHWERVVEATLSRIQTLEGQPISEVGLQGMKRALVEGAVSRVEYFQLGKTIALLGGIEARDALLETLRNTSSFPYQNHPGESYGTTRRIYAATEAARGLTWLLVSNSLSKADKLTLHDQLLRMKEDTGLHRDTRAGIELALDKELPGLLRRILNRVSRNT